MALAAMPEGGAYYPQIPYQLGKQPIKNPQPPMSIRAPSKPPAAPKKKSSGGGSSHTNARRQALNNYGGGGGGGGGYSSSVGSNSTGQISPISAPSGDSFLAGDSDYQNQVAQYNKALADYQAQNNAEINQYNVGYGRSRNDLGIQQGRDDDALQNDFASRGMYVSGLQAQDRSKLLDDYARRFSDLDTSRSDFLADQSRNLANYKNDVGLNMTKAKQDALNRRAMQYNL